MKGNEWQIIGIVDAEGLSDDNKDILHILIREFQKKLSNNKLRLRYYRNQVKVKNLGIAVPKSFNKLDPKVDGIAKAVDMLAERSMFDGFAVDGEDSEELNAIMEQNEFATTYEMALTSELIYSCGFWTVSNGEKYPIVRYYNAENGCAIWDGDKNRIKAGFVVTDYEYDPNGITKPIHVVLHTDKEVVNIHRDGSKGVAESQEHSFGRPWMEVMAYKPTDDRPFGKSVVSKSAMSIVDEMKRELLRTSLHSELYTSPAKYIMGVSNLDDETAEQIKRLFKYNDILINEKDEDGDKPEVGQLPASSMEPHIANMRRLSMQMAAEASIPLNSMGISGDANPTSAEALRASLDDLCIKAEKLNQTNGRSIKNVALMALAAKRGQNWEDVAEERIEACFKNPSQPSMSSQADAMMKIAVSLPGITDTDVYLERLGFNDAERQRLRASKKRIEAEQRIKALNNPMPLGDSEKEQINASESVQITTGDNNGKSESETASVV